MSRRLALLLAVVLVVSGCAAPTARPTPDTDWQWPDDPATDRLGWEEGYWYNESIAVDQSDGLNETEREAFVARTMARVEHIRGLEFERPVPVEVISREEFRESRDDRDDRSAEYRAWNNQIWEALLLVGEGTDVSDVFDELYGGAVQGYYSSSEERIVVVSDAETPAIDRATLAHELVHALQDQQFGLSSDARTQDGQLARQGIVEGDARYVEQLYEERCASGVFECVANAPGDGGGGGALSVPGVFLTIYTPYSEGPTLVDDLRRRGGWAAVDRAYRRSPESTEQLIHPAAYPDETPVDVTVSDRSSAEWSRFSAPESDTVGEASMVAMFWQHGYIERSALRRGTGNYSAYNYDHPVTAGWGGDRVVPYRSGEGDDAEYGYVWATEWDTVADAKKFAAAYRTTLQLYLGGQRVEAGVYRVPDDRPFGDAFRVTRSGTRVTIVNAPTVEDLDDVHRPG